MTRRHLFRRAADTLIGAFAGSMLARLPLAGAMAEAELDFKPQRDVYYFREGEAVWWKSTQDGTDWTLIGHIEKPVGRAIGHVVSGP